MVWTSPMAGRLWSIDGFVGEEAGGDEGEGGVLVAGGADRALEGMSAFDDEGRHGLAS